MLRKAGPPRPDPWSARCFRHRPKTAAAALLLSVIAVCSLLLTGCWGYRETDETAHVLLLGLEKGKENVLSLTALIAVPRRMGGGGGGGGVGGGGGGGGGQKPVITVSVECRTILTGLDMINSVIERRATLDHLKVILFSREIAEEGLDRYMAPFLRYPQFRRTVYLGVCQKSCRELLEKFEPVMEANPAKYAELLMGSQKYVGFIPFNQIHHFVTDWKSKSAEPVCVLVDLEREGEGKEGGKPSGKEEGDFLAGQLPRKGGNKIEFIGSAVFRGTKMVGTIDGSETVILNVLRGWLKETFVAFPDPSRPDRFVIVRLLAERKPKIEVRSGEDGGASIDVRVFLDAEIISVQSGENYERPDRLAELEKKINTLLENKTQSLIRKTQEEYRADIFGFGLKARRLAATYPEWQKLDWPEIYPRAAVSVTYAVKIRRFGLLRKTTVT